MWTMFLSNLWMYSFGAGKLGIDQPSAVSSTPPDDSLLTFILSSICYSQLALIDSHKMLGSALPFNWQNFRSSGVL